MVAKIKAILSHIPKWLMSGIVLALVLWLTLAPHPTGNTNIHLFPGADKVVHGIMFGGLAFVVCIDMMHARHWHKLGLATIGCIAFCTCILGIIIEIAQEKMGLGRSLEILDMLADSAGALIGCGIWAALNDNFADSE